MKFVALYICFAGVALTTCSYLPTAGPTTARVIDEATQDNQTRYDLVDIDANVVAALSKQPAASFRTRFGTQAHPPPPKIGIGDSVSVSIWEAAGGDCSALRRSPVFPRARAMW
jgi:polysaccharide export outer membrane protein